MAAPGRKGTPKRVLSGFFLILIALGVFLGSVSTWGTAGLTPKLGLDLEGGTQLVLAPRLVGDETASPEQVRQARDIIVQRVDSQGVSGAEVTTRGETNIVVSMPGLPDEETEEAIRRSSQMQFRPVLAATAGSPVPQPTPTTSTDGNGQGSADEGSTASPTDDASASESSTTSSSDNAAVPQALREGTTPSESATSSDEKSPTDSTSSDATRVDPKSAMDIAWVTDEIRQRYQELDCSKDGALDKVVDDPDKPLVTCSADGSEKFILGPVVVRGGEIADASAGYQLSQTGQPTNVVEIQLSFTDEATEKYAEVSKKMVTLQPPRSRLAATLDSRVIVAPSFNEPITTGQASITGGFTLEEAQALAEQLKFGALPLSFDLQTRAQISPTLGEEQLRYGIIAGIIGLFLVAGYSLAQYRALGLVTVASIVLAGVLTYLTITILGWSHNYRLDMAGVTGLVIAIGVTADSFIVYFERIRDEVREGRTLRTAVDTGWNRAKRTILVADGVTFLAAAVLYLLASSGVRGFAFTLGLTTLIDILIVFTFTHPVVTLLAGRPFFRDGHAWSGVDPERLGAKAFRYAGRGRVAHSTARVSTEGSAS